MCTIIQTHPHLDTHCNVWLSSDCAELHHLHSEIAEQQGHVEHLRKLLKEAVALLDELEEQVKTHNCHDHIPLPPVLPEDEPAFHSLEDDNDEEQMNGFKLKARDHVERIEVRRQQSVEKEKRTLPAYMGKQQDLSLSQSPSSSSSSSSSSQKSQEKERKQKERKEKKKSKKQVTISASNASTTIPSDGSIATSSLSSSFGDQLSSLRAEMESSFEDTLQKLSKELGQIASAERNKFRKEREQTAPSEPSMTFGAEEEGADSIQEVIQTMPAETLNFESMMNDNVDFHQPDNNHYFHSESEEDDDDDEDEELEYEKEEMALERPLKRKLTNEDGMLSPSNSPEKKNKKVKRTNGSGKSWKRSRQTQRLMRLATNGEDLRTLVTKWMKSAKVNQKHRISRYRTIEETVEEGCKWLLSLLDRHLMADD